MPASIAAHSFHVTSNAQRQESASAGVYVQKRTPPTPPSPRLLHIYISRPRERPVIRDPFRHPLPHFRVAGERALSFPPFSCKSSARSIRSPFPWRPPTLSGPSRARSNTSQTTTARVLSPEITPNCPFPTVLSFTRSARALACCLSVSERILPKQPTSCTSSSGDANASRLTTTATLMT